jgi:hypothetical protein
MHGSRRRLEGTLAETYPQLPRTVTTIHSFALSLVNRWRRSLGSSRPYVIGDDAEDTLFGTQRSFDDILKSATALMQSPTVRSFVASTYPVILIDEFQDCHAQPLSLVQSMAGCATLLLAADEFQLLDTTVSGCPAVDWIRTLRGHGAADIVELTTCHRTTVQSILNATTALRHDAQLTGESIPIFACPAAGPAAYRMLEALVYAPPGTRCTGTCAVLTPSHDAWVHDVLTSCDKQLAKNRRSLVGWTIETSEQEAVDQLLTALDAADPVRHKDAWADPGTRDAALVRHAAEHVLRFARVRGLPTIPRGAVAYLAKRLLHVQRTRGRHSPKRIVTTIHGAKNREFDHVFILWPYKVRGDREMKLRLLYNAISRARRTVMLLVRGDAKRFAEDSVLRQLGDPKPAIPPKKKRTATAPRLSSRARRVP